MATKALKSRARLIDGLPNATLAILLTPLGTCIATSKTINAEPIADAGPINDLKRTGIRHSVSTVLERVIQYILTRKTSHRA